MITRMNRYLGVAAMLLLCIVTLSADVKPTIYIGPQLRDGYRETNAGIRDSIRDLQQEFQKAGFGITTRDHAEIILLVTSRIAVDQGSIVLESPIGASRLYSPVPILLPTIRTTLVVGTYESPRQSAGSTWRSAARATVRDVATWLQENQ